MENIFKKVKQVLFNKLREYKQKQNFHRISKRTQGLRNTERSDLERWENNKELLKNWNERTRLMAEMVPVSAKVIEFGAGNMALKNYLPSTCEYQGSDLLQRSPEMIVCDLNKGINFSLSTYDTAVFSGVLEYIFDIEKVFEQLKGEIKTIIVSYACSDISSANRLASGWLSDYTKKSLEEIFFHNGYNIEDYLEWRKQSIYKLTRK